MDYKNGQIYCIRSYQTDHIYIGSTAQPLHKKEKLLEQQKEYRLANKEKVNENQRQYRLKKKFETTIIKPSTT